MLKRAEYMPDPIDQSPSRHASAWSGIGGLAVLGAASNLLLLAGPLFMLQVYDRVLPSRSLPTLVALTVLVAALYCFYAFVEWLRARIANRVGAYVEGKLSPALLGTYARASGRGRQDPMRDLDSVRSFLSGPGPMALFDLPWMPAYLCLIYLLHPVLGLVTAGGALVIVAMLVASEFAARGPARSSAAALAQRQRLADDVLAGREVISAMAMQADLQPRWNAAVSGVGDAMTSGTDRNSVFTTIIRAFRYLLQSVVLATGAWLVLMGESSAGLIIGASILSARAVAPVEQAVGQWRAFVAARQAWGRLRDMVRTPVVPRLVELPPPVRSLIVTGLTVTAPDQDLALVQNARFGLEAGDGVGIVGASGSGKSSLARALVGVWPHSAGEVRLDGQLLDHYAPRTIGQSVGYMPQDVGLFSGTVAENISRFARHADSRTIIAAAEAAGVHHLIARLPDGYETQVGDGGLALSGGQRQRIGLARALFGNPFLIVLDEPNSNLDAEGDLALTAALLAARQRGAIVVVVAHRPSAIAAVDKLLFLHDGRQVAFGPKDEVLRSIGRQQEKGSVHA